MKRELRAYFASPIGYVFLTAMYLFSGFFFFSSSLAIDYADLSGVFTGLFMLVLFLVPILTMRLFSEDRKNKTDQALLTAPISLVGLVMGKFFAAALVYLLGIAVTLVYGVVISVFAPLNWAVVLGNFVATLLLGVALITVGMFISSMTENQVIAAVGGFGVALFLLLVDMFSEVFSGPLAALMIAALSFYNRYSGFLYGIFNVADVVYFLSVSAVFLFLTVRVFEKRRWA